MKYQYVKIEISKQEKKELRLVALDKSTSFQKLLGSIVRQYLVDKVRG